MRFIQYLLFVSFLGLIVIILMNLLNALAVDDARVMRTEAEMTTLYQLFETIAFWDNVLHNVPWCKQLIKFNVIPRSGKLFFLPFGKTEPAHYIWITKGFCEFAS